MKKTALLFFLALPAFAQQPDPEALLARAAKLYTGAEAYYFVASEKTVTSNGEARKETGNLVLAARDAEGRSRVEFDDRSQGGVAVFDGTSRWVYVPAMRRYAKLPKELPTAAQSGGMNFDVLARRYLDRYGSLDQRVLNADTVRKETLGMDGGDVVCQVVEVSYDPPPGMRGGLIERVYWIAEDSGLIVQEHSTASMTSPNNPAGRVEVVQEIVFQRAKVDEQLEKELFVFVPPPGAQQVESLRPDAQNAGSPVSTEAPDFTLRDLSGESVQLSSKRGDVVLLDFWATWCGPCRYDMPFVQNLAERYADRGLKVYGVNSEDVEQAAAYLRQNDLTFPTLVDPGMRTAKLFQVNALPTFVVIDRQGRLAGYMRGTRTEKQLEQALLKAGL